MAKNKAYLSGHLRCDDLLEKYYLCTFGLRDGFNDALTNALVNTFLGDINNWGGVNYKSEGRGSEILSKK